MNSGQAIEPSDLSDNEEKPELIECISLPPPSTGSSVSEIEALFTTMLNYSNLHLNAVSQDDDQNGGWREQN